MALYLEQYLDNLQSLPGEVQRNLRLIRELDEKVSTAVSRADSLGVHYAKEEETLSAEERRQRRDEIQTLLTKSKECSEQKWQISMQLYELVDKHIRRLDNELARFERELKRKVIHAKMDFADGAHSSAESTAASERRGDQLQLHGKSRATIKASRRARASIDESSASENAPPKSAKKKKKTMGSEMSSTTAGPSSPSAGPSAAGTIQPLSPGPLGVEQLAALSGAALIQQLVGVGPAVMDMPVDPNEPVYCTCRQVSYGEMVGCDNPDCPIEWFHFGCVGITSKPKGKWFCPMCKDVGKKKGTGVS